MTFKSPWSNSGAISRRPLATAQTLSHSVTGPLFLIKLRALVGQASEDVMNSGPSVEGWVGRRGGD